MLDLLWECAWSNGSTTRGEELLVSNAGQNGATCHVWKLAKHHTACSQQKKLKVLRLDSLNGKDWSCLTLLVLVFNVFAHEFASSKHRALKQWQCMRRASANSTVHHWSYHCLALAFQDSIKVRDITEAPYTNFPSCVQQHWECRPGLEPYRTWIWIEIPIPAGFWIASSVVTW